MSPASSPAFNLKRGAPTGGRDENVVDWQHDMCSSAKRQRVTAPPLVTEPVFTTDSSFVQGVRGTAGECSAGSGGNASSSSSSTQTATGFSQGDSQGHHQLKSPVGSQSSPAGVTRRGVAGIELFSTEYLSTLDRDAIRVVIRLLLPALVDRKEDLARTRNKK